ncbi:single-stranded DNA-binding protein [Deinococcus soli (ex Cha et al. 2016)]|uniref:Single-strand DNA-binding protein n=2 Tax=Deinococcus soli (ex Cha et al. 2016) TaxID=1309411 RepID=A0ACC6KGW2_9DEIO|nr:single-stranded DNA-binding protein [Deinococcus soli (ex Cha et al. 2016)]MDR6219023.1 single-strand DNA-binding protein [Deinococcus soli (ex Cha et al. 2016)]MDR6328820.1 single-strand DNA-binding protein [Deinococcus soli (ex Cha et al. 2016)]MDR6751692.1 single-strand DNA-binding protein [Deinococcus soli (ex Cha et al. 2016)]
MARGMNHVYLVGALARDPELRYTPSGTAVFEATVAGEDTVVGNDGKERTLPWYHRVSMLGKPAEWMGDRNMKAGDPVMVEGTVDYSQWEAPEGGKRSMVRVRAVRFEGLDRPNAELINDAGGGVRLAKGSNEVRLIGNVTRDPELRYTPAGDAVLGLGLAVNENWVDKSGQRQEKTHWIDATLWRELAEAFKEIKKGDPVYITGRLVNEAWTDKDGNKRNTTKVEVRSAELLARGNAEGGAPRAPAAPRQQPAQTGAPAASRAARPPARSGGLDIDAGLDDFPPEEEDLPF